MTWPHFLEENQAFAVTALWLTICTSMLPEVVMIMFIKLLSSIKLRYHPSIEYYQKARIGEWYYEGIRNSPSHKIFKRMYKQFLICAFIIRLLNILIISRPLLLDFIKVISLPVLHYMYHLQINLYYPF